jgi:hypothetical protein
VPIAGKLPPDGLVGVDDVISGAVDQMQNHRAAFDMAQEPGAKASTLAGPFDQPRQVGDDEFPVVEPHHAELRS